MRVARAQRDRERLRTISRKFNFPLGSSRRFSRRFTSVNIRAVYRLLNIDKVPTLVLYNERFPLASSCNFLLPDGEMLFRSDFQSRVKSRGHFRERETPRFPLDSITVGWGEIVHRLFVATQ